MQPDEVKGIVVRTPNGNLGFLPSGLKLQQDAEGNAKPVYVELITDVVTCSRWINPATQQPYFEMCDLTQLQEVDAKQDWQENFPDGNGAYIPKDGKR